MTSLSRKNVHYVLALAVLTLLELTPADLPEQVDISITVLGFNTAI